MRNKFVKRMIALTAATTMFCSSISMPVIASTQQEQSAVLSDDSSVPDQSSEEKNIPDTIEDSSIPTTDDLKNQDDSISEELTEELADSTVQKNEEKVVGETNIEHGVYFVLGDTVTHYNKEMIHFYLDDKEIPYEYNQENGRITISSDYNGLKLKSIINISENEIAENEFVYTADNVVNINLDIKKIEKDNGNTKNSPSNKEESVIQAENASIAYGDSADIKELCQITTNSTADITYTIKSGEDVVSINENGVISGLKVGESTILIHTDENDTYTEGNKEINISVEKRNLGNIKISDISFNDEDLSVVYDGNTEFTIRGFLSVNNSENIPVDVVIKVSDKNIGQKTTTVQDIHLVDENDSVTFQYTAKNEVGPTIEIKARPVQISYTDHSIVYDGNPEEIGSVWLPQDWMNDIDVIGADEELIEADGLKYLLSGFDDNSSSGVRFNASAGSNYMYYNSDYLHYSKKSSLYNGYEYYADGTSMYDDGTLIYDEATKSYRYIDAITISILNENVGNYEVSLAEGSGGDIYVYTPNYSDEESWNQIKSYIDDTKAYVLNKGQNNQVIYTRPGGELSFPIIDWTDVFFDEIIFHNNDGTDSTNNTYNVPFDAADGPLSIRYYRTSSFLGNASTSENTVPSGQVIVDATAPKVTFDGIASSQENNWFIELFDNKTISFNVTVEDINETNSTYASGLKDAKYKIFTVHNDEEVETTLQQILNNKEYLTWSNIPDNHQINIQEIENGYQFVIVWANDNVGNSNLVTSNGTVIDTTAPSIVINNLDTSLVYEDDVQYQLVINDNVLKAHSGLDSVEVSLIVDGQPTTSKTITNANDALTDSFIISSDILDEMIGIQNTTIADIEKSSQGIQINGTILAKNINSNDIVLKVTVRDKSGNEFTKETEPFIIDTVKPVIDVSLAGESSHQKYYKDTCTLTVTYQERNFVASRAKATVKVNGQEEKKAIDEINSLHLKSVVDSQEGYDKTDFTDERTITYTFEVGQQENIENYYEWLFEYFDINDHCLASNDDRSGIYVDKVKPQLTWNLLDDNNQAVTGQANAEEAKYYNHNLYGTLKVQDTNFDKNFADIITINNTTEGQWNDNEYSCIYTKDALHSFEASIYDLAGNKTSIKKNYFGIDKTAPTGIVKEKKDGTIFDSFVETIRKLLLRQDVVQYEVSDAKDNISGVASIQYYLDTSKNNMDNVLTLSELELMHWTDYENVIAVNKDVAATVYVRIQDKAGNVTYINTTGVIVDSPEKGSPSISIALEGNSYQGYYTGDVDFKIDVVEPDNNNAFSGIKSVTWKLVADNGNIITQEDTTNYQDIRSIQKATVSGTIDKTKNEYDDVKLIVKVTDHAGNTTTKVYDEILKVDISAPVVTARYDNNAVQNGRYFNSPRSLTISIKEKHLDENKSVFNITYNKISGSYTIDELKNGAVEDIETTGITHLSNDEHEIVLNIGKEGTEADFTIKPYIVDEAGYEGTIDYAPDTKAHERFVIDTVAPVLDTKYIMSSHLIKNASTDKESPLYDTVSIEPILLINEKQFSDGIHNVQISVTVDGTDYQGNKVNIDTEYATSASDIKNWTGQGDNCVVFTMENHKFIDDANYALSMEVTDLAGNKTVLDTNYFTVDKTPVKGQLININDNGTIFEKFTTTLKGFFFSKTDVEFKIANVKDTTSGVKDISYYVSSNEQPLTLAELETKPFITYTDTFSVPKENQGVVYARFEDNAGNVAYINTDNLVVVDSTNPDAPEITITTRSPRGEVFTSDVQFVVHVKDPSVNGTYSGLKNVEWYVNTADDKQTQYHSLNTEDELFADTSKRIQEYEFEGTISADLNNLNNVYLFVKATDNAGNEIVKKYDSVIRIDITNPFVNISYDNNEVKNGKYFNKSRVMTCSVYETNFEESGLTFDIAIDGVNKTYSVEDIKNNKANDVYFVSSQANATNSVYIYKIAFGEKETSDHDFDVTVHVTDEAGNENEEIIFEEGTVAPTAFTIDKVAPILLATYVGGEKGKTDIGSSEDTRVYDKKSMTVSLNVDERNFVDADKYGNVDTFITATDVNGGLIQNAYDIGNTEDVTKWTKNDNTYTFTMPMFLTDANYTFTISAEDLAGNITSLNPAYFTIDKTAPSAVLYRTEDTNHPFEQLFSQLTGFVFSQSNVGYNVQDVYDNTSGINRVAYYIDDEETLLSAKELDQKEFTVYTGEFFVPVESQGVVYAKIQDKAGNITYISSDKLTVVDNSSPNAPKITIETEKPESGFYTGDIGFSVYVDDPVSGDTYSGLNRIIWYVEADGVLTQPEQSYTFDSTDTRVRDYTFQGTISADKNDANEIYLYVEAWDNAGNHVLKKLDENLAIDITKPTLTISYDKNNPKNQSYFNTSRTMTAEIIEKNFDEEGLTFDITIDGKRKTYSVDDIKENKADGVYFESSEFNQEEMLHTYKITFGKEENTDHDYIVHVHVADKAGNTNSDTVYVDGTEAKNEFTIDQISPKIALSYVGGENGEMGVGDSAETRTYDKKSVTTTLNVTERNLIVDGQYGVAKTTVTAVDNDGNTVLNAYIPGNIEDISGWVNEASEHIFVMPTFANDANYSLYVTIEDLAGNITTTEPVYFTVDKTAPVGKLYCIEESSNPFIQLYEMIRGYFFSQNDIGYNIQDVSDKTSGIDSISYYIDSQERILTDKELLTKEFTRYNGNFYVKAESQGIAYAKIQDKAGNITYISTDILAVVDSSEPDSPVITIETEKPATGFYTSDIDFSVHVEDPISGNTYSGLDNIIWYVKADGVLTQPDYSYKNEFLDKTKRIRTYDFTGTIKADSNDANEIYVFVEAWDNAGNHTIKRLDENLSIDITNPVLTVSYDNNTPKNEMYFNTNRTMTCEINEKNFEASGLTYDITVDGVKGTYSLDDIKNGVISGISFVSGEENPENRYYAYSIGFGLNNEEIEHTYTVIPHVKDMADNQNLFINYKDGTVAKETFVIDHIKPVIHTEYHGSNGEIIQAGHTEENPVYDRQYIISSLEVIEKYLAVNNVYGKVDITITAKNSKKNDVNNAYNEQYIIDAENLEKWIHDTNKHNYQMVKFDNDANYSLQITVEDLAGNKNTIRPDYFTVDKTPPTGEFRCGLTDESNIFNKLASQLLGYIFQNKDIPFLITKTEDETSGFKKAYYYIDSEEKALTAAELRSRVFTEYDGSFNVPVESQGVVYIQLEDRAGNIAYISSSKMAIADNTKPRIVKTDILSDARNGFYTSDVDFSITAEDPISHNTYAGLTEIQWYILNKDPDIGEAKSKATVETEPFKDKTKRIEKYTFTGKIPSSEYDSNYIYLVMRAKDNAGNSIEETTSEPIRIDVTVPRIIVSYNNNAPKNEKYFNTERIMDIDIIERNYKESGLTFDITIDGVKNTYSVKEIRDGKVAGVRLLQVHDSGDQNKYNNSKNRNITYKLGFGTDGKTDHDYTIVPSVVDMAGNKNKGITYTNGTVCKEHFVIDEIAPVLQVAYTGGTSGAINCSTNAAIPSYDRASMTVDLTVTERNFITNRAKSAVEIAVTSKDVSGKDIAAYSSSDIESAKNASTWSNKNNTHTRRMAAFTNDANYSFTASVVDLAGNQCPAYPVHFFTVDKTPPTGSISTGAQGLTGIFRTFYNQVRFWFFDNKGIDVERTAEDLTSGVASIRYYMWEPGPERRNTFTGLSINELNGLNWTDWNGTLRVNPDKGVIVYERIQDKAGNVTYINTEGGIISDGTSPAKPVIQITTAEPANGIYNGNVPFTISVSEQESGNTYSGLKNVSYQISNNGTVTQSGNYDNELTDRTARVRNIQKTETIDAQRNNSNHVKIEVTATDYAGNTSTESKEIMIDVTAPVIDITYDNNSPRNGKYYNTVRTATVRVTERNFNPSDFTLSPTEVRGANPIVNGWSLASNMGESDQAVSTCTVVFSTDGDYTLTAACRDKAGNKATYDRVDAFVIDRTAPVIDVTFDKNDARYEKYYNETRNASIRVTDRFMETSDFHTHVTALLDGVQINAPGLNGWSQGNDIATNSMSFVQDGDYILELTCTDLAGNEAKVYRSAEFTIDKTAPELSFFNIKDKSANKGTVQPGIQYSDRNFTAEGILIQIAGTRHNISIPEGVWENGNISGKFTLNDIVHTSDADDIYTITAVITDKAGNTTEQKLQFSVNRFGSVYTFDNILKNVISKFYLKDVPEFKITETNADVLHDQRIIISRNGEIIAVKEGRDFTINESAHDGSWKVYDYNFNKDIFTEEGLYEIRISSKDAAGNDQDNQIKNDPIRFIVDHTAPSVSFAKISNNGRYTETKHAFDINVSDNFAFGQVFLYINQKQIKAYDMEDIEKANGRLNYTLQSADNWQEIKVVAVDAAGNKTDEKVIRVLITTNKFLQFRENKPLFYGTIGGLLGLIGLIFLILFRRKKKDAKGTETTDDLKRTADMNNTEDITDE